MDKFWKQFKSGTDIRGVASEGVAGQKIGNIYSVKLDRCCHADSSFSLKAKFWLSQSLHPL